MKNIEKFIKKCQENNWLEKGSRNNNLPIIVKIAKTNGLEEQEALDALQNEGGWSMEKSDIKSFRNAWKKYEPDEKYMKDAWKKNLNSEADFAAKSNDEYFKDNEDIKILEYWFKPDDCICLGKKVDDCYIDILGDENLKIKTSSFQFMAISVFKKPGCSRTLENVKELRYFLIESDSLDKQTQLDLAFKMVEFGLPVKSVVDSGNKSLHILLKTKPYDDVDKWKEDGKKILKLFNSLNENLIDKAVFDGSRLTRMPNGVRIKDEAKLTRQKIIYLDMLKAADDDWSKYSGLVEKVEEFVIFLNGGRLPLIFENELEKGNFKQIGKEIKASADYAIDFENEKCPVDDIFYNGKELYASFKDLRGLMVTQMSKLSGYIVPFVREDVKKELCIHNPTIDRETKEERPSRFSLGMIEIPIKSFGFKMTLEDLPTMWNNYTPGFITKSAERIGKVKECPSEFTKLLDNLADEKCKNWLVNHLSCYFWLLKNGFKRYGSSYVLQTVPVFVGPQGTGKTTLAMMIGNAICKDGYRDVSLEQLSSAQFNDFYESGCMAVNEVGATSLDRKANRNSLKRWTDPKVTVNKKHLTPYTIDNTAYKVMTANSSVYGVLSLDQGENRRWQYIEGGIGKRIEEVVDFELLEAQKIDFFAWVMSLKPDFEQATHVFDTESKIQDQELSKSKVELVVEWLQSWLAKSEWMGFTTKTVKLAYEEYTGDRVDAVTDRTLSIALTKIYGKRKQAGGSIILNKYTTVGRGQEFWKNPYYQGKQEESQTASAHIHLDNRLQLDDSDEVM